MVAVTEPGFAGHYLEQVAALFGHQSDCFLAQSVDGTGRRIRDELARTEIRRFRRAIIQLPLLAQLSGLRGFSRRFPTAGTVFASRLGPARLPS